MTIKEYLNKLADRTPAPGGGSAAALTGALGSALLAMSAKYVLRRDAGESAIRRLMALMREDEKVYHRLAREIKKRRPKKLLRLYKDAINVPLEVCVLSAESASGCAAISSRCRTSIMSDIVEAVILCEAAFLSAKLNIKINLRSIEDTAYKNRISRKLAAEEKKIQKAKKAVLAKARKFFR
ncbi:MAG: cyclodeaminase/cyclohydrolase family protein [Candidatus Omnitrophota bacterium]|nr:cyclodeaminase/cyclohydrolase family protein [Candidatus Omnitrophota bacterium]